MRRKLFKRRRLRPKAKGDNKDKLNFSSRIIAADGLICLGLGIACFLLFIAMVVISTKHRGEAGALVGGLGVLGFTVSLVSFIVSLKILDAEYVEENIPKAAVAVNFIDVLIFLGVYAYGIFIGMA